jgi:hypothetical protein
MNAENQPLTESENALIAAVRASETHNCVDCGRPLIRKDHVFLPPEERFSGRCYECREKQRPAPCEPITTGNEPIVGGDWTFKEAAEQSILADFGKDRTCPQCEQRVEKCNCWMGRS